MKNMFKNAEQSFKDFDNFFELVTKEHTLKLSLGVTVGHYRGAPRLNVVINEETLYSKKLAKGKHFLNLECILQDKKEVVIEISMSEKGLKDTAIKDGKILKDKFIVIDQMIINNYDIFSDIDLFYEKFKYRNNINNMEEPVKSGFWQNSSLILKFELPFCLWYQQNTSRNITLSENLEYQDKKMLAEHQYAELVEKVKLLK
jgi:hypothetical protein